MVEYIPPSTRHLELILYALDQAKPGRPGSLMAPLQKIGENLSHRGIVMLISDFYEDPDIVMEASKHLRYRGHDLIVFHVLDPAEMDFPFEEASSFRDLESGQMIPIVPDELAEEYRTLVHEHTAELERRFAASQIDYAVLNTARPLDFALFQYLSSREKRSRGR